MEATTKHTKDAKMDWPQKSAKTTKNRPLTLALSPDGVEGKRGRAPDAGLETKVIYGGE